MSIKRPLITSSVCVFPMVFSRIKRYLAIVIDFEKLKAGADSMKEGVSYKRLSFTSFCYIIRLYKNLLLSLYYALKLKIQS